MARTATHPGARKMMRPGKEDDEAVGARRVKRACHRHQGVSTSVDIRVRARVTWASSTLHRASGPTCKEPDLFLVLLICQVPVL